MHLSLYRSIYGLQGHLTLKLLSLISTDVESL
jgi:hypothetical protein